MPYTCIDGSLCLCGWFVVPLPPLSVEGSLPLAGVLWSGKLSICSWRAVTLRVLGVGPSRICPTDLVGPNEVDSPCSVGPSSGCPSWAAAAGGGSYPIIVSDASHLWRQYRIVMVRLLSCLPFSKALRLLSSMDSCACVWIIVGRLVSIGQFPRPRPLPPLAGGVVWLFSVLE